MKIKGLDGKIYKWQLGQYVGNQNMNASSYHENAREILHEVFPTLQILEEVYIPGERLYLDFYIPLKKLAIEVQGEQHEEYTPFMHKDKLGFGRAQTRDKRKAEFCRINGITLIYFYPDEDEECWKKKLGIN